jgi:hypothetical protein
MGLATRKKMKIRTRCLIFPTKVGRSTEVIDEELGATIERWLGKGCWLHRRGGSQYLVEISHRQLD